jgi:aminopeptidase N
MARLFTWFDFYVTPVWWDELWLNESLVFFLTSLCLKQLSETDESFADYKDTWLLFGRYKAHAIEMDQFKSNHKIRDTVVDTEHAEFIYDSITYYKGASIFAYFYNVVGSEKFLAILKKFFGSDNNHSNYNSFISSVISIGDGKHTNIIEPFIDHRGINNLVCALESHGDHIKEFCVTQHPCSNAVEDNYYNYEIDVSMPLTIGFIGL